MEGQVTSHLGRRGFWVASVVVVVGGGGGSGFGSELTRCGGASWRVGLGGKRWIF